MTENKKLLIIYKDSNISCLEKLKILFDVTVIPKLKRINFKKYKKEGNNLISRYNDIIFSTSSEIIFFICASEINSLSIEKIINFELKSDFDYFLDKKTTNTLEFFSGIAIKRECLIKTGCFDKNLFYNAYLNFLVNYSLFFPKKHFSVPTFYPKFFNLLKYLFWNSFERFFYSQKIFYNQHYQDIDKKINMIYINPINRTSRYLIEHLMRLFNLRMNKFVEAGTCAEYW